MKWFFLIGLFFGSVGFADSDSDELPPKEVMRQVLNHCKTSWADNYDMQEHCISMEFESYWKIRDTEDLIKKAKSKGGK